MGECQSPVDETVIKGFKKLSSILIWSQSLLLTRLCRFNYTHLVSQAEIYAQQYIDMRLVFVGFFLYKRLKIAGI